MTTIAVVAVDGQAVETALALGWAFMVLKAE